MEIIKCLYIPKQIKNHSDWIALHAGDCGLLIGTHYKEVDFLKAASGGHCLFPANEKSKFVEWLLIKSHKEHNIRLKDFYYLPLNYMYFNMAGNKIPIVLYEWRTKE